MSRDNITKLSFVLILVLGAFFARAAHYGVLQSADVAVVTAGTPIATTTDSFGGGLGTAFADNAGGVINTTSATSSGSASTVNGVAPFTQVGTALAPTLDYHEALVADLESGDRLWGDQDATRWPLASVTKLMTAAIATDTLNPNDTITITSEMFAVDPNDTTLSVGDTYTVSDLMKIMLLQSSNVAAEALCDFYGHARFLAAMNARAQSLGMTDTYYQDPSGLSAGNESTADDLVLLAQNVYANYPDILAITRMPQATVTNLATGKKMVVKSINDFAGTPGFLGGKTGYTTLADGNLLSIFKYENRPVIVIIMGTDDNARFDNTTTLYNWFKANFR